MKLTIFLILFTLICQVPAKMTLLIRMSEKIQPYEKIWLAVCQVESRMDPMAYNPKEQATGISQIRPIRIKDYNQRTGKNYKLSEMFDPIKSKEVFMYYACKLEDPDLLTRKWNGSGKQTYKYLSKVRVVLKSNSL